MQGVHFSGSYSSLTPNSDKRTRLTYLSTAKKHQKIDEFLQKSEQRLRIDMLHPEIKLHLVVEPGWFGRKSKITIHNDSKIDHDKPATEVKKHFWNTFNSFFNKVIKEAQKVQKQDEHKHWHKL